MARNDQPLLLHLSHPLLLFRLAQINLLEKKMFNKCCNHHRNIQTLLIEIFSIKKGFAPPIMKSIIKGRNNTYNVRSFQEFETERKRAVYFGLETISYRSLQFWSLLPVHMKQLNSLDQFKRSVRQWVCNTCPCRLCKVYLQNVGFL